MTHHKFSIGFRSGLFPGHSNVWIFFLLQEFLHHLASMTWSAIMRKNVAVMDCHVDLKLAFQQIHVFFTINGCFWRQKIKSSCTHEGHCSSNHLARRMFHCWESVLFLVSCSSRLSNPIFSNRKLTYRRTSEKSSLFLISVYQSACLLAKSRRFFFIASVKRGFLAGLHDLSPDFRDSLL